MKLTIYILCWFLVLSLFVIPLGYLVTLPEVNQLLELFHNENLRVAIVNTFIISLCVGIGCLLIGVPLSWLLTRTDLPWKAHLRTWFCLPYAIPPYVGAIGWIILANPSSGLLNTLFGLQLNVYSYSGLIWVETSFLFTFVLLTNLTALDKMDSSLEEAARLSGANPFQVFRDISLPLLKPAILNGFILCFLATAASFGVPAMIGGPARIYLMTTQIYSYQRMGTTQGVQNSIGISVILMLVTLVLLMVMQELSQKSHTQIIGGKSSKASLIKLKKIKWPVFLFLVILLFGIFILPLLGLLLSSVSSVQGDWSISNLTFSNFYRVLFETQETGRAIGNSFFLGIAAAVICVIVSFFIAYFSTKTNWKGKNILGIFASIPFSTPGSVLALALILVFSQGYFGIGPSLYNTLGLILIAYITKYMSLSIKTLQDGYSQIHISLDEAARVSGAHWWQVMKSIYFPILKSSIIAAVFFIFMPILGELTMTILLTGPQLETIGTLIFSLQEYSDMAGGGASVLSILIVLIVFSMNFILKKISKGHYGL